MPFPPEKIWKVLAGVADYPRWWPAEFRVRVIAATPDLIGSELEVRPTRGLGFRCRVEDVDAPRRMRMAYSGGSLEGHGEWRLERLETGTRLVYDLDVQARGWLVALLDRIISLPRVHSKQMQGILHAIETFADD
jgi:uncharacterized protein YndB with AHSA1/START domain